MRAGWTLAAALACGTAGCCSGGVGLAVIVEARFSDDGMAVDDATVECLGDGEVRVNGERWGGGNSRDMQHGFAKILHFISHTETLHPGEVIASGTVGTGCGLELCRFLKPNDVVELEIEKIGVLRNRIVRA